MYLKNLCVCLTLLSTVMANSVGFQKVGMRFATFDFNSDGFLQKSEFYALRKAYPSKCAKNGGVVRDKLLLFTQIDLNRDDKLSKSELTTHRKNRK